MMAKDLYELFWNRRAIVSVSNGFCLSFTFGLIMYFYVTPSIDMYYDQYYQCVCKSRVCV